MKRVYVNEEWCLGCHLCEYNCAFANSGMSDMATALKGFILIGKTERAGIYTSLIREKTPLDTVDFETLKKVATTAAFSLENRRKKFGGVV